MLDELWAAIPVDGTTMYKLNLNMFYQLGSCLNTIAELSTTKIDEVKIIRQGERIKISLERLLSALPELELCQSKATDLISNIDDFLEWIVSPRDKYDSQFTYQSEKRCKQIIVKAKELETVLLADLQRLEAFHITRKMGCEPITLTNHFEETLSDTAQNKIGQDIIEEIRRSGRCLAFDCYTASAFHILRATELVLHQYYLVVRRPEKQMPLDNWGAYIGKLYGIEEHEVKKVVALLQEIKYIDRNQIMHPELVLTQDQAIGVINSAKSAIEAMTQRLPEIDGK